MRTLDILFLLGRPLGPVYSMIMSMRARLYSRRLFSVNTFDIPVVSVGNLTMGGTGKTPMVAALAEHFVQQGRRVAIVSRGYGGSVREPVNVVSDGETTFLSPGEAGDEPVMLARSLPGVVVLTGRKRALPCRHAIERFNVDIIILDDGFQHMAVERDLNLVLFNATSLAGNSRVFPGGELREPVSALNRADAFIITGLTDENRARALAFSQLLRSRFSQQPVFTTTTKPSSLVPLRPADETVRTPSLPLFAFSGIAHPERFYAQLEGCGYQIQGELSFQDHKEYSQGEMRKIEKHARASGAKGIVTTFKDAVKLEQVQFSLPVFYLKISSLCDDAFWDFVYDKTVSKEPADSSV